VIEVGVLSKYNYDQDVFKFIDFLV